MADDQRIDPAARKRFDELQDHVDRRMLLLVVALAVILVACAAVLAILFSEVRDQQRRNGELTVQNHALVVAVQRNRIEVVRRSCEEDKQRHDAAPAAALAVFDHRVATQLGRATPAQRAQIRSSRAFTAAIIDALVRVLAPKLDCDQQVAKLTRGVSP